MHLNETHFAFGLIEEAGNRDDKSDAGDFDRLNGEGPQDDPAFGAVNAVPDHAERR